MLALKHSDMEAFTDGNWFRTGHTQWSQSRRLLGPLGRKTLLRVQMLKYVLIFNK